MISTKLVIWLLSAYTVLAVLVRAWRMARRVKRMQRDSDSRTLAKATVVIRGAGATCIAAAIWGGAPILGTSLDAITRFNEYHYLALALLISAMVQAFAIWKWGVLRSRAAELMSASLVVALGVGALAGLLFISSVPGDGIVAEKVEFPLAGKWVVVTGGRTHLTNYHHESPAAQNYAVDLVLFGNAQGSEGKPVTSPADGVVAEVRRADSQAEQFTPEGNLVVVRTASGTDIWLAHLQDQSITVETGEQVVAGQAIARVGTTGSADMPHLHIHGEKAGAPVPLLFGPEGRFLVRGDVMEGQGVRE